MTDMFSFKLSKSFVEEYKDREPDWGWKDAAGNSIGELTFVRTYSRIKKDGTKEKWWETCERVINGMYSLQKDHCISNRLEWNGHKAQASAQEAYDRLFQLKWTPPGRGLAQIGTPLVNLHKNGASLQNCAVTGFPDDNKHDPGFPFAWLVEAMMLGIGVGANVVEKSTIMVTSPNDDDTEVYQIPDTREGWAISVGKLVNSYLKPNQPKIEFDYSLIRPYGAPIATFGGTASGPEPLEDGHEKIRAVLEKNVGSLLTSRTIVDCYNLIGCFVVAGNARRSAELMMGAYDDDDFASLKDPEGFEDRPWGFMSNNSIAVKVGDDYNKFIERTVTNGEPGYIWMDTSKAYGRLIDPPNYKDQRISAYNPCAEQSLEKYECCTLVEVHLNRAESYEDFQRSLKFAYGYAKTVTLLSTPWPKTNAVMQRNRRIGLSLTGIAGFVETHNLFTFRTWADSGYAEVQRLDDTYSEWLGIRNSIKTTTVKPSGTVSLLSGATPGVHWAPGGEYFLRAIRFAEHDNTWKLLEESGYTVEDDIYSPNTKVVYFPLKSDAGRAESEVSIYEKIHLAAEAQKYWSDNSVSVTVSFDQKTESDDVAKVLRMYEASLKTVSFLPMGNTVYAQQPYQKLSKEEYEERSKGLKKLDSSLLYDSGEEAESEAFCTTDSCMIPAK